MGRDASQTRFVEIRNRGGHFLDVHKPRLDTPEPSAHPSGSVHRIDVATGALQSTSGREEDPVIPVVRGKLFPAAGNAMAAAAKDVALVPGEVRPPANAAR